MTADLDAFLAGERLDDVAVFLSDDILDNGSALADVADRVEGGYVLVVDGERGRPVLSRAVGADPMALARRAEREGAVDRDLAGGSCPDDGDDHAPRFTFAFAEAENEDAGGLYAEGDVIHAYVQCSCGTAYSDRWLVD